jgi:hypothetical protein
MIVRQGWIFGSLFCLEHQESLSVAVEMRSHLEWHSSVALAGIVSCFGVLYLYTSMISRR